VNPAESGIRVAIGVSGAGKTHGIRREVYSAAAHYPVIVLDRMHEWDRGDAGCTTVADAAKVIQAGARLVIVRPADVVSAAEAACLWARDYPGQAGVAIPEAHRPLPNGARLSPGAEDVACAWRHYKVSLWLDTQRFALLNRTITEQAREIKLYAVAGELDTRLVAELGGRELALLVRESAARLSKGEPGWHVALGLVRVPPYRLSRD
jgi:hypothetical protein